MIKVKILGIVGSPRKGHNTEIMISEALKGAESVGNAETEIQSLAGKEISPCKAGGAVVQGNSRWGGQEYTVNFIINHLLVMRNVPVAPDLQLSESPGASERASQFDVPSMMDNKQALAVSFNLGKRVAEMAKILKAGRLALRNELPTEYFPPERLL